MKLTGLTLLTCFLLLPATGCKKSQNQNDAVRAGVLQHLSTVNGINLAAMDMFITNVSINGDKAQAQVEFRLKGSSAPEAGMKMSYNLEKHGDRWVVIKKPSMGGAPLSAPTEPLPPVHPSTAPPAAPES